LSLSRIGVVAAVTRLAIIVLGSAALAGVAAAHSPEGPPSPLVQQPKPEMQANCPGLVAGNRPPLIPASLRLAALNADQVRITFVGHATFLIESPELVRIVTDYNDYVHPPLLPDIITMNHAHDTHYTDHPDPAIKHVLRGWGPSPEEPAIWDLKYRDVRVRNVMMSGSSGGCT